jgi:ferredoxin
MNKKCIIIYESIYNGNTYKIAKTMAHSLACKCISSENALTVDLSQYDLIGFGSGIYFGCHHPSIFKVAAKLDKSVQNVFLFSSRGNPRLGKYHEKLKKLLVDKQKNIRGEYSVRGYDETGPWTIIGGGNKGKPNEKDLRKAVKFLHTALSEYCMPDYYQQVKDRLSVKQGAVNTYKLHKNNADVILKGDLVTINQTACKGCGKCVDICPLDVIELQNHKAIPINELDCTLCRLCEKNCMERAIHFHFTWRDAIKIAVRHSNKNSL